MINLDINNRYAFLKSHEGKIIFVPTFNVSKNIADLLDKLHLEYSDTEFATDVDFFIMKGRNFTKKNKYYGKNIYLLEDVLKVKLLVREDKLDSKFVYESYLPMIQSNDRDTKCLGYDLLIRDLSYGDIVNIGELVKKRIYPFYDCFVMPYWFEPNLTADYGITNLWPIIGMMYKRNTALV